MTAPQLIETLSASGIRLSAANNKLQVDAPRGLLTIELRAELTNHKAELLQIVATAFCKICKAPLLKDNNGRHSWCPAGHFDQWLPNPKPQPESVNYCADCGAWLQDDGNCPICLVKI
jgi:hypothetical protein